MAKFLLLLVVCSISAACAQEENRSGKALEDLVAQRGGYEEDPQCVDMSRYSHVMFNETRFTLRGYHCENKCETKTKQLCRDVEVTECELEVYADCRKELIETDNLFVDGTNTLEYIPHICVQDGTEDLHEKGSVADCKMETKLQCDSVWVTAADGYTRVERKENCHEVEVENCLLVEENVATPYPTYDCPLGPAIHYVEPVYDQGRIMSRYARRCETKALPVCHTHTVTKCKTLTYEECAEEWIRTAVDITSHIPYQEYDHRLKCPEDPPTIYDPPTDYITTTPITTTTTTTTPPYQPPPQYVPPSTFGGKNGTVPSA